MATKHFARVFTAQTEGIDGHIVSVETDLARGLYSFSVVGLPDKAVEEARDRLSAAIKHSGFPSPKSHNRKVVISLAPASLKKEGSHFDLPMALAYLLASEDINFEPKKSSFLGELGLDGTLRRVKGVLALTRAAKEAGFEKIFLPKENAEEAALVGGIEIYGAESLLEVVEHLDERKMEGKKKSGKKIDKTPRTKIKNDEVAGMNLSDIRGQASAKRGLEIAAAGRHNIALYGPAGTGKTMLARAASSILPPLSEEEALEVTAIHSVAGALDGTYISNPPFRSPHHTASYVSVVGGGSTPRPGEVTLAHRGVLFLDEFPEFERRVIETLRQPLEENVVTVSRAKGTYRFPANFMLIAAMNPCPCGNYGTTKRCICTPGDMARYQRKLSGPIVDRIDMWLEVPLIPHTDLLGKKGGEESSSVLERVSRARNIQEKRYGETAKTNSDLSARELEKLELGEKVKDTLIQSAARLALSPRATHRVMKLSRTIADLAGSEIIELPHLLEALQYRPKINT